MDRCRSGNGAAVRSQSHGHCAGLIPFIGLLDDAAVVSACLFMLERDLVAYRAWKSEGEEVSPE